MLSEEILKQHYIDSGLFTSETVNDIFDNTKNIIEINQNGKITPYPRILFTSGGYIRTQNGMRSTQEERTQSIVSFRSLVLSVKTGKNVINTYYNTPHSTLIPQRVFVDLDKSLVELTYEDLFSIILKLLKPVGISTFDLGIAECYKDSNNTYNYHIVLPSHSISLADMSILVKLYNETAEIKLDGSIYAKNRLFRLPFSTDKDKPYPYTTKFYEDWDIANTNDTILITVPESLKTNKIITNPHSSVSSIDKNINPYLCLYSSYNLDAFPLELKLSYLTDFVRLNEHIFRIHNYNMDPVENEINKNLFIRSIIYTVEISLSRYLGIIDSKQKQIKRNKLLTRIVSKILTIFEPCLTPNASADGSLIKTASRITSDKIVSDVYLWKVLDKIDPRLFNEFINNINIMQN